MIQVRKKLTCPNSLLSHSRGKLASSYFVSKAQFLPYNLTALPLSTCLEKLKALTWQPLATMPTLLNVTLVTVPYKLSDSSLVAWQISMSKPVSPSRDVKN